MESIERKGKKRDRQRNWWIITEKNKNLIRVNRTLIIRNLEAKSVNEFISKENIKYGAIFKTLAN